VAWTFSDRVEPVRVLIRDRDRKSTRPFDEVFRSVGVRIVRTPIPAPQANGIAERFVRTVRAECLDSLLIMNRRHLERVLAVYVDHHDHHRPHRSLDLRPPAHLPTISERSGRPEVGRIMRRDRLGGLIHEYRRAA